MQSQIINTSTDVRLDSMSLETVIELFVKFFNNKDFPTSLSPNKPTVEG